MPEPPLPIGKEQSHLPESQNRMEIESVSAPQSRLGKEEKSKSKSMK